MGSSSPRCHHGGSEWLVLSSEDSVWLAGHCECWETTRGAQAPQAWMGGGSGQSWVQRTAVGFWEGSQEGEGGEKENRLENLKGWNLE